MLTNEEVGSPLREAPSHSPTRYFSHYREIATYRYVPWPRLRTRAHISMAAYLDGGPDTNRSRLEHHRSSMRSVVLEHIDALGIAHIFDGILLYTSLISILSYHWLLDELFTCMWDFVRGTLSWRSGTRAEARKGCPHELVQEPVLLRYPPVGSSIGRLKGHDTQGTVGYTNITIDG